MSQPNPFVAELLERSASGFAGYAAGLLMERAPGIEERYAPDAFDSWRAHLTQRIIELSAALSTGEPKLFAARLAWSRKSFVARGREVGDLEISLKALAEVLTENLPEIAREDCASYIGVALETLASGESELDASELDPRDPGDKLALQYLQHVLEGNVAAAIKLAAGASNNGLDAAGVYSQILLPAQREIGRLWHQGDVSIAEEHLVTATTQRAMSVIANSADRAPSNGRTILAATVAGNVHDIGLCAVADMYQLAGWRSIFLGANVPVREMPSTLTFFEADLLLLGATLSVHIPKVTETIRVVRDRSERDVKIIVGGAAFDEVPDLWKRVGADGYAANIDDAVTVGCKLVGLRVH